MTSSSLLNSRSRRKALATKLSPSVIPLVAEPISKTLVANFIPSIETDRPLQKSRSVLVRGVCCDLPWGIIKSLKASFSPQLIHNLPSFLVILSVNALRKHLFNQSTVGFFPVPFGQIRLLLGVFTLKINPPSGFLHELFMLLC